VQGIRLQARSGEHLVPWVPGLRYCGYKETNGSVEPLSDGSEELLFLDSFPWLPEGTPVPGYKTIPLGTSSRYHWDSLAARYFKRESRLVFSGFSIHGEGGARAGLSLLPKSAHVISSDLWREPREEHSFNAKLPALAYLASIGKLLRACDSFAETSALTDSETFIAGVGRVNGQLSGLDFSYKPLRPQNLFSFPGNDPRSIKGVSFDKESLYPTVGGFHSYNLTVTDPRLAAEYDPFYALLPPNTVIEVDSDTTEFWLPFSETSPDDVLALAQNGRLCLSEHGGFSIPLDFPVTGDYLKVHHGQWSHCVLIVPRPSELPLSKTLILSTRVGRRNRDVTTYSVYSPGHDGPLPGSYCIRSEIKNWAPSKRMLADDSRKKYAWFTKEHAIYDAATLAAHDLYLKRKESPGWRETSLDFGPGSLHDTLRDTSLVFFPNDPEVFCSTPIPGHKQIFRTPSPELLLSHPEAHYHYLSAVRRIDPVTRKLLFTPEVQSVLMAGDISA